jgi:hypothetical protein
MSILAACLMVLAGIVNIILGAGMLEIAPMHGRPYAWIFWVSLTLMATGSALFIFGVCLGDKIHYSPKNQLKGLSLRGPA